MRNILLVGLGLLIGAAGGGGGAYWRLREYAPAQAAAPDTAPASGELLSKHFLYGIPRSRQGRVGLLVREGFVTAVSYDHKAPLWTAMRWTKDDLKRASGMQLPERDFDRDPELPAAAQADTDFDFEIEGLDRGHLVPHACNIAWGEDNCDMGSLMSNIAPQQPKLNRGAWRELEELQRSLVTRKKIKTIWVFSGCVFAEKPRRIANGVAVPSHFFKIISWQSAGGTLELRAFLYPQEAGKGDPSDYLTTVDDIEERAGLDFFPDLDAEQQRTLEAQRATAL